MNNFYSIHRVVIFGRSNSLDNAKRYDFCVQNKIKIFKIVFPLFFQLYIILGNVFGIYIHLSKKFSQINWNKRTNKIILSFTYILVVDSITLRLYLALNNQMIIHLIDLLIKPYYKQLKIGYILMKRLYFIVKRRR